MVRRSLLVAVLAAGICGAGSARALDEGCTGDCDGDQRVDIVDLITAVRVVLDEAPLTACPSILCNGGDSTAIDCLIRAIDYGLRGCDIEGIPCGNAVCGIGEYCCNALLDICTPIGQGCIQ